ncbi:plasmid segregation protein ParM domain-containing protein [Cupriavidus sp. TMH.W2]|uniref:plasmid segregation protein ParM domain-containing protein n=1 Tax=Cupriavidus sp. TMH.W2 TaxID=3434465 RepID=UPI003D76B2E8
MAKTALAIAASQSDLPPAFVGIDDGHYGIKAVTDAFGELRSVYVPSRIATGTMVDLGTKAEDNCYRDADGRTFTVSAQLPFTDTRLGTYALSTENHVLIHHALIQLGLAGREVRIATGLPVSDFYLNGKTNDDFIQRKIEALANATLRNANDSVPLARIVGHTVYSEAIAAFYDCAVDEQGDEVTALMDQAENGPIAFVDIGGGTTDVAVVLNGGSSVDTDRSGSARLGGLSLNAAVENGIKAAKGWKSLTPKQVDAAIETGTVRALGADHDFSELVRYEKEQLAKKIIAELAKRVGDGADLEAVYFVGGGTKLLHEQLNNLYPHAVFVGDPQYANSNGLWKAVKYLQG